MRKCQSWFCTKDFLRIRAILNSRIPNNSGCMKTNWEKEQDRPWPRDYWLLTADWTQLPSVSGFKWRQETGHGGPWPGQYTQQSQSSTFHVKLKRIAKDNFYFFPPEKSKLIHNVLYPLHGLHRKVIIFWVWVHVWGPRNDSLYQLRAESAGGEYYED